MCVCHKCNKASELTTSGLDKKNGRLGNMNYGLLIKVKVSLNIFVKLQIRTSSRRVESFSASMDMVNDLLKIVFHFCGLKKL